MSRFWQRCHAYIGCWCNCIGIAWFSYFVSIWEVLAILFAILQAACRQTTAYSRADVVLLNKCGVTCRHTQTSKAGDCKVYSRGCSVFSQQPCCVYMATVVLQADFERRVGQITSKVALFLKTHQIGCFAKDMPPNRDFLPFLATC